MTEEKSIKTGDTVVISALEKQKLPCGFEPYCAFERVTTDFHEHYALGRLMNEQLKEIHSTMRTTSDHIKQTNENYKELSKWTNTYIDRSMPIKSHIYILLASLSILATFAGVMQYIQHLGH